MTKIKIVKACAAAGKPLEAGKVYAIGKDLDEKTGRLLVRMGRAVALEKPQRGKAAASGDE